jgi:hypothetical protein
MRIPQILDKYRICHGFWGSALGDDFGAFRLPGPYLDSLLIIASPGDANENIPWEHVSVSLKNRCPNWKEMCFVKDLFWEEEEAVMQLHPPRSQWINNHPFCLHLWRPVEEKIPLPPPVAVGYKSLNRRNTTSFVNREKL